MSIQQLMISPGHANYYREDWRFLVDQHVDYLIKSSNTMVHSIESALRYKFEGDLEGYLAAIKFPPHLWYVVIKMNGFTDGREFGETTGQLYLPNEQDVEKLMSTWQSVYKS